MDLHATWLAVVAEISRNYVSLVAALVSVISAFVASNQRRAEMRIGWTRDLVSWAHEAMAALASAKLSVVPLVQNRADDAALRALRARLSALVDQGRLFFENDQGFRPRILDPLMRAYRLLEVDGGEYSNEHLMKCMDRHRREFWELAQEAAGPRWWRKAVGAPTSAGGDGAADFAELPH